MDKLDTFVCTSFARNLISKMFNVMYVRIYVDRLPNSKKGSHQKMLTKKTTCRYLCKEKTNIENDSQFLLILAVIFQYQQARNDYKIGLLEFV